MTLLSIRDLKVAYRGREVLHGVSLDVEPGECLGIVGESGCGKSTLALAAIRYLPREGIVTGGNIAISGHDVTTRNAAGMRDLWARDIAMVYQDPSRALNPTMTVSAQLEEAYGSAFRTRAARRSRAEADLNQMRIADPSRVLTAFPHELSGGMQQRVIIAIALARNPGLLVLDEPTTGLDATVEAGILETVDGLRRDRGIGVLLISHNLHMVARMAGRVGVLYGGVMVEEGPANAVLNAPRHPYTDRLLRCMPRAGRHKADGILDTITGTLPAAGEPVRGCVFWPRCHAADAICETVPEARGTGGHRARCHFDPPFATPLETSTQAEPAPSMPGIVLRTANIGKTYSQRGVPFVALKPLSLDLRAGETLGVVGESGSGKTTLARALLGLAAPDDGGAVFLGEHRLAATLRHRSRGERQALQMIFQNPDSALNRSQSIGTILSRQVLRSTGIRGRSLRERVASVAEAVRLNPTQMRQTPRALSGGLKQRVAIARAIAGSPQVVVCDEPTSSLDVSVQAAILNLLNQLQREKQMAYLFISHDLNVVRYMSDRVAVLYRGRLIEMGPASAVFTGPNHPYTRGLLAAAALPLVDGPPPPAGCVFQAVCPRKLGRICETDEPALRGDQHGISCHIAREAL